MKIVGRLTDDVDQRSAVDLDMGSRRGKQHVSRYYAPVPDVNLGPRALGGAPLRSRNQKRIAKNPLHFARQTRKRATTFDRETHTGLDAMQQRGELIGAERADAAVGAQIDVNHFLRDQLGIVMRPAQRLAPLSDTRLPQRPHRRDFERHGKAYAWRIEFHP